MSPQRCVHRLLLSASVLLAFAGSATAVPFVDCESRFAADPDGWHTCDCFFAVAMRPEPATDPQGLHDEAVRRLEAHLERDSANPCLRFNLGRFAFLAGDASAEELLRTAAEGYSARGQAAGEVLARLNLSRFLRGRGRGEPARRELAAAGQAADAAGDATLKAQVELQQARLLLSEGGDLEHVDRLLRQVESKAFPDSSPSLKRDTLQSLGNVRFLLGRYAEAEAYYQRMTEVTRGAADPFGEATARYSRVITHMAKGPAYASREEAIELLRASLAASSLAGQHQAEADARLRLGKLLGGDEGRDELRRAIRLARKHAAPDVLGRALSALASNRLADAPDEARQLLHESRAAALASPHYGAAATGLSDRLAVAWATLPREAAIDHGLGALDLIERLRDRQRAETGRARLFAPWTEIYYTLAGRLLGPAGEGSEPPDTARAFAVMERMRARVLLEAVAAARIAPVPVPAALAEERDELLDRLVRVNRALLDPDLDEVARSRQLDDLAQLERQQAELEDRIARSTPGSDTPTPFASLPEVQAALAEDEALLSFQIAPWQDIYGDFAGGSWLLVATRTAHRAYRLPGRSDFEPALRVLMGLFPRRDSSPTPAARKLFDQLLGEALADLPASVRRLVLIPDGNLHRLPSAALLAEDGSPLAARYQLSSAPSATLWLHWRAVPPQATGRRTLAFADPLLPDAATGAATDAAAIAGSSGGRVPGDHVANDTAVDRGWPLARGARLKALPRARDEGRNAIRQMGPSGTLLTGHAASEAALKAFADDEIGLLHFAAHAVIDAEHPHRSAVVLAPGEASEDGLLQPHEIAKLPLAGSVVVLSTCQSASGAVLAGEGPLSLARAFFEAGARTVVGSLWPLRDDEAARLFKRFYRHLAKGVTVAEALALAQRDRIAAGAPAAAWAGVSVLGDATVVPVPVRPQRDLGPLGLVLLALALGIAAAWIRLRRP